MIKKILTSILIFIVYTINVYALNNQGDLWLNPAVQQKGEGQSFTVSLQLNNGTTDMDAAKFEINYDNTKVELDTSIGLEGVLRGSDVPNSNLTVNTSPPTGNDMRIVVGNAANLSGDNLNILTINFKTKTAFTSGSTVVELIEEESTVTVETNDGDGDFYNLTLNNAGDATINFLIDGSPSHIPDMTDETDTGSSNTDNITSDTTPDFKLQCEKVGDILTLYVDGVKTSVTHTCATATESVVVTVPSALTEGNHTITYTQDPVIGGESPESVALDIVIDTTAPTGLTVTEPTNEGIIKDTTPTIKGTGTAGDVINVTDGNGHTCTTIVASDGTWTCDISPALPTGSVTLSVTETDPAGNVSNPVEVTFTVDISGGGGNGSSGGGGTADTSVSPYPIITYPTLNQEILDNVDTINVRGTTEANITVKLTLTDSEGHSVIVTTTTDGNGYFVAPANISSFVKGDVNIALLATDQSGNTATASTVFKIIDDRDPSCNGKPTNVTLELPSNGTIVDLCTEVLTVKGKTTPNSEVTVILTDSEGNKVTGKTTSDANGNYSVDLDLEGIVAGRVDIKVITKAPDGKISVTHDYFIYGSDDNSDYPFTPNMCDGGNIKLTGIQAKFESKYPNPYHKSSVKKVVKDFNTNYALRDYMKKLISDKYSNNIKKLSKHRVMEVWPEFLSLVETMESNNITYPKIGNLSNESSRDVFIALYWIVSEYYFDVYYSNWKDNNGAYMSGQSYCEGINGKADNGTFKGFTKTLNACDPKAKPRFKVIIVGYGTNGTRIYGRIRVDAEGNPCYTGKYGVPNQGISQDKGEYHYFVDNPKIWE